MSANNKQNILIIKLKNHNYMWKNKIIYLILLFFILILDWWVKYYISKNMQLSQEKILIPGIIKIKYIINQGMAFGMFDNNRNFIIILAAISCIIFTIIFIFLNIKLYFISITFILSGSLANLIARSWSPLDSKGKKGGVIDMFQWDFNFLGSNTYIFNIADLFINLGIISFVILFIINLITNYMKENKKND